MVSRDFTGRLQADLKIQRRFLGFYYHCCHLVFSVFLVVCLPLPCKRGVFLFTLSFLWAVSLLDVFIIFWLIFIIRCSNYVPTKMMVIEKKEIQNSLLSSVNYNSVNLSTFQLNIFEDISLKNLLILSNDYSCKNASHENVYLTNIVHFSFSKNVST